MIDTGRGVQLATIDLEHIDQLREWRNHPEIFKWCRQVDLITEGQQRAWFERQSADTSIKMYRIRTKKQPLVGVCGLTSIDMLSRRAEFSLYIAPGYQKSGYGKAALATLLDHGFKSFGLNCVWGESFKGNPAIKMFEALGFKKEGTRRDFYYRNGHFIDCHLFSILCSEWVGGGTNRSQAIPNSHPAGFSYDFISTSGAPRAVHIQESAAEEGP